MQQAPTNGEAVKTERGKTQETLENKGENEDFDRSILGQNEPTCRHLEKFRTPDLRKRYNSASSPPSWPRARPCR
jgi:hypothetical protein